jgi:hypothetical protein
MTFYRRMLFAGRIVQKRHVNPLAQNSRELNSFTSFFYFNILFDTCKCYARRQFTTGEHGDRIFGEIKPLKYFLRARPNGGLRLKTGGVFSKAK